MTDANPRRPPMKTGTLNLRVDTAIKRKAVKAATDGKSTITAYVEGLIRRDLKRRRRHRPGRANL